MKITYDTLCFENDDDDSDGFCYIKIQDGYIELHANDVKTEFPLVFETEEDISFFTKKLKKLLRKVKKDTDD